MIRVLMVAFHALLLFAIVNCFDNYYPSVKIKQGILKGKYMKSTNGHTFSAFLSIPYMKPPVGDLRFKAPIPGEPWKGVLDATKNHELCPQIDLFSPNPTWKGIEDCTYINVFTRQLKPNQRPSYPVMIFIHGGGYFFGSALMYDPDYLIDYDIILVTFNYRIGPLGFLSTGDEVLPGNNGLKDQSLAIKWVYENIEQFGGDQKQITLFGESAGGSSTHLHYFSPLTKGLFNGGISQSGTAFCRWTIGERATITSRSKMLASSFNCPTENTNELVKCLQNVEAMKLTKGITAFMEWDIEPEIAFKPVVETNHEGAFLPEHPLDVLKSGKYADVPWVTGVNTEEGAMRVASFYKNPILIEELNKDFSKIMSIIFETKNINFEKIRKFYFGDQDINNSTRFELVDLFSDIMFTFCAYLGVNLHLKYSTQPVYYYMYGHNHPHSFSQVFGEHDPLYGTCHCDDLLSLFPINSLFNSTERTALDKRISDLVCTMWTNFAKTGDPTPNLNTIIQTKWEPVMTKNLEYSYIGSHLYHAKDMFSNRIKFWRDIEATTRKTLIDELQCG